MKDIRIRAARHDDAAALAIISSQPSVVWGTNQLPAQTAELWRKRLEGNDPDTSLLLVAEVDGQPVGMIGLHGGSRPRTRHAAVLGMMVHERHQGRGIGRALIAAALDAADRWLNLVRIELEVFPDNERAIALYEKFGFQHEGRKRLCSFRDGQYVDSLLMARIRPGFEQQAGS